MKKTLVLVLSLLMVLSLASVASASMEIVGGNFALVYTYDSAKEDNAKKSTFDWNNSDVRVNMEGKYSNGNFTGYAYSRLDAKNGFYFKKAEMDHILFEGLSIGLAYDVDDIKVFDRFVWSYKLKDYEKIYKAVGLATVKFKNDFLDAGIYNNLNAGGQFKNLVIAKTTFGDLKVDGAFSYWDQKVNDDDVAKSTIDLMAEAVYDLGFMKAGAGFMFENTKEDDKDDIKYTYISGAVEVPVDALKIYGKLTYRMDDDEDLAGIAQLVGKLTYGNYELSATRYGFNFYDAVKDKKDIKFEIVGKIKNLMGTSNEIELKAAAAKNETKEEFDFGEAKYTVKYLFKF